MGVSVKRKTLCILVMAFSLLIIFLIAGFLLVRGGTPAIPEPQEILVQNDTQSSVPSGDNIPPEDTQADVPEDTPAPFQAVPTVPDSACFTYEELADGTLRITEYDESKNTRNPYQVIIPSTLDGKPVSTLGNQSIQADDLIELVISDGITTLENEVFVSNWEPYLVVLPDSVIHIDEKAFYRKYGDILPIAISCDSETSYAYEYAMDNGFACQLVNPVTEENAFLWDYATSCRNSYPYLCHIRQEGDLYNYVIIEYLDIAGQLQMHMNSRYFISSYIWDSNEFAVLVLDKKSGAVRQCIDTASFHAPEKIGLYNLTDVFCHNLLSNADWNFDGNPDLCLDLGYSGAEFDYAIFLFDEDSELYTEAKDFPLDNIRLRPDKQCIDSGYNDGPAEHYVYRYQYIDGIITHVATLSLYEIWEDDSRGVGVRDERLIDGEWQVYREENIILENDFSDDAFQAAHEQLTYLYVDDGYWDF